MIKVGMKFVSRAGNTIRILEKSTIDDRDGRPMTIFKGHIEKAVNGHELIRGKIHTFFDDGKWFIHPGGIHDLHKELD